jgi:choline dehydrogenase-like flavoprotein
MSSASKISVRRDEDHVRAIKLVHPFSDAKRSCGRPALSTTPLEENNGTMRSAMSPALRAAIEAASGERLNDQRGFDAIVIGAGAAGGLAAMLLTQAGLTVLVLDAGWREGFWEAPLRQTISTVVATVADPRLQTKLPPSVVDFGRKALRAAGKIHQPVQTRCFAWDLAPGAFVDDRENPYINEPGSSFNWFRARQIGGRMIIPGHGRQYYRLSDSDFRPDDPAFPRWPLTRGELGPWYDLVERLLGLSGGVEHCPWIPDGQVANILTSSPAEAEVIELLKRRWHGTQPILGRSAPPLASIEAAAKTKRLLLRQGAIVRDVAVDACGRATGVNWFDRGTNRMRAMRAPIIFLCASSLETTRILLSSGSAASPSGIGTRSGVLGRCLMDHVLVTGQGVGGALPGEPVSGEPGRCVYLPRFDLREGDGASKSPGRGYGVQIYRWSIGRGKSYFNGVSLAEMAPRPENCVTLDPRHKDRWGCPVLRIRCHHSDAETRMAKDQSAALRELGKLLGVSFYRLDNTPAAPGTAIHECGTARMGDSPAESVLDHHNQCWEARGLYVTDASSFPSQGAQNPTLTILALTARACDHAVSEASH